MQSDLGTTTGLLMASHVGKSQPNWGLPLGLPLRINKRKRITAHCCNPLILLVGAIGLEPTTPTMSRWEHKTIWDVLGRNLTREKWHPRSRLIS